MQFEVLRGIRATRVDGPESLLRQGEYYVTMSPGYRALVINCPNCRASNLMPKAFQFKTANWFERLFRIDRGLTTGVPMHCYCCQKDIKIVESEISIGATSHV